MKSARNLKISKVLDRALRISSDLGDLLVHLGTKPTPIALVSIAARAYDSYKKSGVTDPSEYFLGWNTLKEASRLSWQLLEFAIEQGYVVPQMNGQDSVILGGEIFGLQFGWVKYSTWAEGPKIPPGQDYRQSSMALGRLVWEVLGPSIKVLTRYPESLYLASDRTEESLPSQTAEYLYQEIRPFLERGKSYSVLLFGEPGTGKSHIMKRVAKAVGGYSFRIPTSSVDMLDCIPQIVEILQPRSILLDDLDRAYNTAQFLSEMEELRCRCPLILASANDLDEVDAAVLRPGRFDRLLEVQRLDPEVLEGLLSGVSPEVKERLQNLPVSYLSQFRDYKECWGDEKALGMVQELIEQQERVQKSQRKPRKAPRSSEE